jgi:NADH:ubiquinone oxidoreductase subunit F (NADH-binding)
MADAARLPRVLAGVRRGVALRLDDHVAVHGPLPPRESRRRDAELIDAVERSGLLGRGGAGFPAAAKMRAVASRRGRRIVVVNGGEGEPASGKDQLLLARTPHLVLDGAVLAAAAVGADEVIVCVKRTAAAALAAVELAVAERADPVEVTVVAVPAGYVAAEESALVNYLNTGSAMPTFVPPRPFERGVEGRPTLIQNVETLADVALVARHGPEWFRALGAGDDPGSSLVTLAGAAAATRVYEVQNGIGLGALVEHAGGATSPPQAYLIGGYGGSWVPAERASQLSLSRAAGVAPGLGAGIVVALPADACGVRETARVAGYLADASARQCGPCQYGLAAIADALDEIADGFAGAGAHARVERWSADVAGRGACGHPDGAVRFVASALFAFRDEIARHESGAGCARDPRRDWVLPLGETAGAVA